LRTLRLLVEYDGTDFAGWQQQPAQRTVQGCLIAAFEKMAARDVAITGAGRTDAGVHAGGQVASVRLASTIPTPGLLRGLNSNLPDDVTVLEVEDAPESFDARRAARGKVYRYLIWNHAVRSSRLRRTTWHHRPPLDTHAMREAAAALVGEHDFRAFRAADCERRTTVRVLRRVDVTREGALVTVEVEGTAFLKNMVRIIVGTLAAVGTGDIPAAAIPALLAGGDRKAAGKTAPACGLTLLRVIY
jgi:tRNA pseudouridine38-40 synthase